MNMEQMLQRHGSPEDQAVWNHAKQVVQREKQVMVSRITANIGDPARRKSYAAKLMKKTPDELRDLLELVPAQNVQTQQPIFLGAGGGPEEIPVGNSSPDEENFLPLPTMNYSEEY